MCGLWYQSAHAVWGPRCGFWYQRKHVYGATMRALLQGQHTPGGYPRPPLTNPREHAGTRLTPFRSTTLKRRVIPGVTIGLIALPVGLIRFIFQRRPNT
jgi:hypothetical protein